MRVSRNELTSMLKQALEGVGLPWGVYEDAAEATVWAQMIGCDVLSSFHQCLTECQQSQHEEIARCASKGRLELRPACATTIHWLGSVAGLMESGFASKENRINDIFLQPCNSPGLMVLPLSRLADQFGVVCAAWLEIATTENSNHRLVTAEFSSGIRFPMLGYFDLPHDAIPQTSELLGAMRIKLGAFSRDDLIEMVGASNLQTLDSNLDEPALCESTYQRALDQGIDIPSMLWDKLSSLANRVLVESSEQSRRGAGA